MADEVAKNLEEWDFWTHGLDPRFFSRVYQRSTQLAIAAAVLAFVFDQKTIAAGLLGGLGVGLFTTWTSELTVRLLFNDGSFPIAKLAIGAIVKMPFLVAGLLGVAGAAYYGHMNIFAVIGGVLLVHGLMLVMVIGMAMQQDRNSERYG